MAEFYSIHRRDIERAQLMTHYRGCFRVWVQEPQPPPLMEPPAEPIAETITIVTFVVSSDGRTYSPAGEVDRKIIADWNERHRETPDSAWSLPSFK
jgi:hypothetical protein